MEDSTQRKNVISNLANTKYIYTILLVLLDFCACYLLIVHAT